MPRELCQSVYLGAHMSYPCCTIDLKSSGLNPSQPRLDRKILSCYLHMVVSTLALALGTSVLDICEKRRDNVIPWQRPSFFAD